MPETNLMYWKQFSSNTKPAFMGNILLPRASFNIILEDVPFRKFKTYEKCMKLT